MQEKGRTERKKDSGFGGGKRQGERERRGTRERERENG